MKSNVNIVQLYRDLRTRCKGAVKNFKSDWKVDRAFLRASVTLNVPLEFVHVARESGTYIFRIHRSDLDTTIPFLFGTSTPRRIMQDYADMFSDNSTAMHDAVHIHYFDGRRLIKIKRENARSIFQKATRLSLIHI